MKLLAFDTATEMCSVALYIDGAVSVREQELARGHGAELLPMIDALLAEAGLSLKQLDTLAFGRGPGGFTGVRLGASVAQGLAFGAGLPVLPVSNLLAVAQRAFDLQPQARRVLVCNDARMSEVYTAVYVRSAVGEVPRLEGVESVRPPSDVELSSSPLATVGAGRGFRAYPLLRERLQSGLLQIHDELLPTAAAMLPAALADWHNGLAVAPAAAQPVYLRDKVAIPSVT
jgi:tRNA threonylcarbamoyladenosine biosynthesis protein TsaB